MDEREAGDNHTPREVGMPAAVDGRRSRPGPAADSHTGHRRRRRAGSERARDAVVDTARPQTLDDVAAEGAELGNEAGNDRPPRRIVLAEGDDLPPSELVICVCAQPGDRLRGVEVEAKHIGVRAGEASSCGSKLHSEDDPGCTLAYWRTSQPVPIPERCDDRVPPACSTRRRASAASSRATVALAAGDELDPL